MPGRRQGGVALGGAHARQAPYDVVAGDCAAVPRGQRGADLSGLRLLCPVARCVGGGFAVVQWSKRTTSLGRASLQDWLTMEKKISKVIVEDVAAGSTQRRHPDK